MTPVSFNGISPTNCLESRSSGWNEGSRAESLLYLADPSLDDAVAPDGDSARFLNLL